jgi:hypothetical protein
MIQGEIPGDNAIGDVLDAGALDATRRPIPARVRSR